MSEERIQIDVPGSGAVSAIQTRAERTARGLAFIYAPGSGAGLTDAFGSFLAAQLAAHGIDTLRFQFPYKEAGQAFPDQTPVLEATWRAAILASGSASGRLVIGGRSMGGRIASYVVAQGLEVRALAPFAYPLHPPGRPDQLRDSHFPLIAVPTLFCSGTRDAYGSPEELRLAAAKVPGAQLHLLEGADHGFAGAKASGRTRRSIWTEAVQALIDFVGALS